MIFVNKDFNAIPAVLKTEKAKELLQQFIDTERKPRGLPLVYAAPSVKKELAKIYHGKCAYCEQKSESIHIHHYRPNSIYPWLALEWSNLIPVCPVCNNESANKFQAIKPFQTIPSTEIAKRANSIYLLLEEALLIHPELSAANTQNTVKDILLEQFDYNIDGEIIGLTEEAKYTIDVFKLNRENLVKRRKVIATDFVHKLKKQVRVFRDIQNLANTEKGRETIKYLFETTLRVELELLRKQVNSENEFAGLGRRMVLKFRDFFKNHFDITDFNILRKAWEYESEEEHGHIADYIYSDNKIDVDYLEHIELWNYFSIKELELSGLENTKEIYFLGENGDGKTLLLQAILITLKDAYIKYFGKKEHLGKILQNIEESKIESYAYGAGANGNYYEETVSYLENIYAYGTNRHQSTFQDDPEFDQEGYLTLFHNDRYKLLNPTVWLKDVKLEEGKGTLTLEIAKKLLEDLLDNNIEIELDGSEVTFTDIRFTERDTKGLSFEQLSDGYKSVMTWVVDLVARLAKKQPEVKHLKDYKAIVLVDEVGLHLHPKWEARLVQRLRHWFPKIQFFFTTHSPVLILNASDDAVFYRLYKEDGVTKISEKFHCSDFADRRLNSLVTSSLFGLETSSMRIFNPEVDNLDTSEDEITYQLRKKIDERVEQLKKDKKNSYLSTDFLQGVIDDVLSEEY